jgi:hypothetical protein
MSPGGRRFRDLAAAQRSKKFINLRVDRRTRLERADSNWNVVPAESRVRKTRNITVAG